MFVFLIILMINLSYSMMFLTVCDEYLQGRIQGVECFKCDMIFGLFQFFGGYMIMMYLRNFCKILKCLKCNWYYKYQEILEIYMKEKYFDNDQQCVYCILSQFYLRFVRGESYFCGYKSYRCEVCNYFIIIKGNLSIYMQFDKYLNNVQELVNGNVEVKMFQ